MTRRDAWGRPHDPRYDREPPPRPDRDDFGQADYSRDYGYDPARRSGYRAAEDRSDGSDYGQADFSEDYGYDPVGRRGYRRDTPPDDARDPYAPPREADLRHESRDRTLPPPRHEERSWRDRGGVSSWFGGPRRRSSDRVLWTVVTERLDSDRRLDSSDIEVLVHGSEVTLNGTVRDRDDKRRAEDLAEVRDVTHVQNNLRVRRRGFGF